MNTQKPRPPWALLVATGLCGIALGAGMLRGLNAIGLEHFPRANEVRMDGTAVLVALGLSLAAGLLVGLFPLAGIAKIGISDALHEVVGEIEIAVGPSSSHERRPFRLASFIKDYRNRQPFGVGAAPQSPTIWNQRRLE